MAATKVIKNRIKSIKNTKKVTKSMELISAVKMQKATERSSAIGNFSQKLEGVFHSIVIPENYNNVLLKNNESNNEVIIVFCSDRGLCGSFNSNVKKVLGQYLKDKDPTRTEIVCYGKKVASTAKSLGFGIREYYRVPTEHFNIDYVKAAIKEQLDRYKANEIGKVTVIFTKFKNIVKQDVVKKTILPLLNIDVEEEEHFKKTEDVLEPSQEELLNYLIDEHIKLSWYSALVNSLASEHASRMVAMKNATEASGELVDLLTLEYNKSRQAAITQEITEIVSGVESMNDADEELNINLNKFKILF